MINKLKEQKGITGADLSISIIIIMLFISIIATLSINVSTSLASKRRLEIATDCMNEIMEMLDRISYNDVKIPDDDDDGKEIINDIREEERFNQEEVGSNQEDTSFEYRIYREILGIGTDPEKENEYKILTVGIEKERYIPSNTNDPLDLITKVTVKIRYKVNKEEESIEVTRLKPIYSIDFE